MLKNDHRDWRDAWIASHQPPENATESGLGRTLGIYLQVSWAVSLTQGQQQGRVGSWHWKQGRQVCLLSSEPSPPLPSLHSQTWNQRTSEKLTIPQERTPQQLTREVAQWEAAGTLYKEWSPLPSKFHLCKKSLWSDLNAFNINRYPGSFGHLRKAYKWMAKIIKKKKKGNSKETAKPSNRRKHKHKQTKNPYKSSCHGSGD